MVKNRFAKLKMPPYNQKCKRFQFEKGERNDEEI